MRRGRRGSGSMSILALEWKKMNILFFRCGKCDRVGMVGLNCNKRDCNTKFHRYGKYLGSEIMT